MCGISTDVVSDPWLFSVYQKAVVVLYDPHILGQLRLIGALLLLFDWGPLLLRLYFEPFQLSYRYFHATGVFS